MKNLLYTICIVSSLILLCRCGSVTECENISETEAIMLLDVSDPNLWLDIEIDITNNLPGFMQRIGLGSISPCQSFKLTIAHLSAKDKLELVSGSISLERKGLSKNNQKEKSNPAPLVQLIKSTIVKYKQLSQNPEMNIRSNIANTLFKAIVNTNKNSKNIFIVFSDMVENNKNVNFYKTIPTEKDISGTIEKLIDSDVLEKLKSFISQGVEIPIIVVLKQEPNGRVNIKDVKRFWNGFFNELKIQNVQFIDNLTNTVEII